MGNPIIRIAPRRQMLPDDLLTEYADRFLGFGNWEAKVWFIGIQEAGGDDEPSVLRRLQAWAKNKKQPIEDAPAFYPLCDNHRWHGKNPSVQPTWRQLIRLDLLIRGRSASPDEILQYQRHSFANSNGDECAFELLPLPSPDAKTWRYLGWSKLPWLQSRRRYQNHVLLQRAISLQQRIEQHRPRVVIFYSSTWHRIWAVTTRAVWAQAIQGQLMGFDRDGISFYVTRHPSAEGDKYFQKIGEFLRAKHFSDF